MRALSDKLLESQILKRYKWELMRKWKCSSNSRRTLSLEPMLPCQVGSWSQLTTALTCLLELIQLSGCTRRRFQTVKLIQNTSSIQHQGKENLWETRLSSRMSRKKRMSALSRPWPSQWVEPLLTNLTSLPKKFQETSECVWLKLCQPISELCLLTRETILNWNTNVTTDNKMFHSYFQSQTPTTILQTKRVTMQLNSKSRSQNCKPWLINSNQSMTPSINSTKPKSKTLKTSKSVVSCLPQDTKLLTKNKRK